MGDKNPILAQERRYYVRLDSVFPVQFQLVSLDGATILSDWTQGFTNNIGKGGICLEINNLKKELAELISARQAKVALAIEMPLGRNPVKAHSTVAWVQAVADQPSRYLVGLRYESIDTQQNARILRYALAKKFFAPLALVLLFLFGLGLTLNAYVNFKLIKGNRVLVEQLVGILQDSSIARQKIKQISREKEEFQLKLQTLEQHLKSLEEEKSKKKEEANKIGQLNTMIDKLTQEKAALQEQLIGLQHKESLVTNELLDIEKKKASIEKANFDKMYQWIKIHQNQQTGLVMSFEGDSNIANWAFIYDQALAEIGRASCRERV